MRLRISASVFPTEDKEKVLRALQNIFPDIDFNEGHDNGDTVVLRGELTNPENMAFSQFQELLRHRKIRDSVEALLHRNYADGKTRLELNKQAAFIGRLNIAEKHPLGSIMIEIECEKEQIHEIVWGAASQKETLDEKE